MKPKPIVTVSHRCSLAKPLNSEQARNASSKFQSRKKKTDEKISAHSQRQHQKQEKKKNLGLANKNVPHKLLFSID